MTALGPFLFGAPFALIALVALPIIWWILRATPPAPKAFELPSMRLLDDIPQLEEVPARTPWWVWLIRTLATIAVVIGLSQPVYAPGAKTSETGPTGPVLIVVDNGWPSAQRWTDMINAARATLDTGDRDTPAHLLLTTPQLLNTDPAERLTRSDMDKRLNSLDPNPWATDRADALERLAASGLTPDRIFYASDGLETDGGAAFAAALADIAPLTVYAAPPKGSIAISEISSETDEVTVTLHRVETRGEHRAFVSALTLDGAALSTGEAIFAAGAATAEARFELPAAALSRIARFQVTGLQGAGTVWLWDSAERSRRVGLVSTTNSAQPLLSDMHYIRKALEPFASITDGEVATLVTAAPDAIIMSDIGQIPDADAEALSQWVEEGGALIRFAGPRLAAQGDTLLPVALRRSSRAFGGALAWDDPQAIASFAPSSPFAGLGVPQDVLIRQQVLARPGPDLSAKTWARLTDGSPLVTAEGRGAGTVILFHITAGPDWSDLPYSGAFEQMLRRAIAAGRGEATTEDDGSYSPQFVLDGFGRLTSAGDFAAPLKSSDFGTITPSEAHPPGLYQGPAGTRALNAAASAEPELLTDWPLAARLLGDAEGRSLRLAGPLLTLAAALLALDLFVALFVAGRVSLRRKRSIGAAAILLIGGLCLSSVQAAEAQSGFQRQPDGSYRRQMQRQGNIQLPLTEGTTQKDLDAALVMRFAYVETGIADLDKRTRAGLIGLSYILNNRTSVEPAEPHGVNLDTDPLDLYPLIYFNIPDGATPLSDVAGAKLNAYMRTGGALLIDTRAGSNIGSQTDVTRLDGLLEGLDAPPLQPVPTNHVLSRSYYILDDFPGRFSDRLLWIEKTGGPDGPSGDGVSRLFIGDADWASAWAVDARGRDVYSVDGGPQQREMARRFGVNLAMYVLTGNYKDDQVHLPALLERLGKKDDEEAPSEPLSEEPLE